MLDEVDTTAQVIFKLVCKTLKIGPSSLCPCGSTRVLAECCDARNSTEMVFAKRAFTDAIRFRDSQGGRIAGLPKGISIGFFWTSHRRLRCLLPGCESNPVSCHLIPENVLKRSFGGHCLSWQGREKLAGSEFSSTGVGKAEAHPVFCGFHDNDLFNSIDQLPPIIATSLELQFQIAFKALAFDLRKLQIFIGVDLQTEIFRPHMATKETTPKSEIIEVDLTFLHEQYIRFSWVHRAFEDALNARDVSNWSWFSYFARSIPCDDSLFFSGIVNPSHDLTGQRINVGDAPAFLVCSFFALDGRLLFLLAAPNDGSAQTYESLFQQVHDADDMTLLWIASNIMTFAGPKPLLPLNHQFANIDLPAVVSQRERATKSCKRSCGEVFPLYDPGHTVPFFSKLDFR